MTTSPGRLALSCVSAVLAAGSIFASTPQESLRVNAASSRLMASRMALGLDADHAFQLRNTHSDELGQTHGRFTQLYKGIRVWGGDAITHTDRHGVELPMTNALLKGIKINVMPSIQSAEALAIAHYDLSPKGDYTSQPTAELVIYPETVLVPRHTGRRHQEDLNAEELTQEVVRYTLAYHVHAELINGTEETRSQDYLINAHTGAILKTWDTLHRSAAVGSGTSQWYGTVSINTNSTTSGYEMRDMTRGTGGTFGNNVTTNLNNGTTGNGTVFTDADNTWGDGLQYNGTSGMSANAQTAAVDAHRGLQATWDMYKNVFGRNGIDNTGKATYSRMHYSTQYDNAFWQDSCFCMTYGDGATGGSVGEADLDTAGHEMTHGVTATSANLTYSGESGGLNESISDIFGTCVEFYTLGGGGAGTVIPDAVGTGTITANYTMFENSWGHPGTALRYMYKPSKDGASKDAWTSTLGSLDVHYSSGPMNRCFYFLARGSSATSTSDYYSSYMPAGMTGIGNDHAAKIVYRALTVYMTASTNYAAARTACISAAKDLYGAGGADEAAVWNAFAAINVGSAWSGGSSTDTTAPTATASESGTAGTITFSATATDNVGVSKVEFYVDGVLKGTDTTSPYSMTLDSTTLTNATHSLVAKAYDAAGNIGTSTAVSFTVSNAVPTGTYIEVEANDTVATANVVAKTISTIQGNLTVATDKDYFALSLAAGQKVTINMTGPTGVDWDLKLVNSAGTQLTISQGSTATESVTYTATTAMTVYANVYAYSGVSATPYSLAVAYSGGTTTDTTAPTATATESGTSGTITFSATATDNVGVTKVEFYVDGVLKGTDTTSPYSMTLDSTTLTNATHSLVAKAYDAAGNVGSSTAVSFTVSNSTTGTSYTEVESNNTTTAANVVADTVTKITGYMGSTTDLDYFKINVAAGHTVTVGMTGPSGVDYDLYLLNSAGTTLKSSLGTTATESVTYTNTGTTTAVYYIKVLAYSGSSTTTPYILTLSR
ncbi:MAG TPA: M4 family metallopeptidase [Geothrix sp.]|nr:M4 family metallopeptidase [Geothrix sp.]